MRRCFVDTNVLLNEKFDFASYDKVYLSIISVQELDDLKRNDRVGHKARLAIKKIRDAPNKEIIRSNSFNVLYERNDDSILSFAADIYACDKNCVFLTDDYCLIIKAQALDLPCEMFEYEEHEVYTGYKKISGTTEFINDLFYDVENGINTYNFLVNEYLILENTDLNKVFEYRYDGDKFVPLVLPSSKVIKGHNSTQRCALDLLNNRNIPIKVLAGGFGTGKTISAVKVGFHHVFDKEYYRTLMYIRNPIPVDDTDIGFLPGSKQEKIYDYCKPFLQYLQGDKVQLDVDDLVKSEKIKMDAVSFLKGVSIEDSFVIMDEAEDLNLRLLKTIGSRIGPKSCIVFTGDWDQAEDKYKHDNGLLKLVQQKKGDPLMGVIVMDKVLRSPVCELFNCLK